MKPGDVDIKHSTRVTELSDAWAFVMEQLEGIDLHQIEITAQSWRNEDDEDWTDTYLVEVSGRVL